METCKKDFEELTLKELGEKRTVEIELEEVNYLKEREIPNLSDIPLSNIENHHEVSIKID